MKGKYIGLIVGAVIALLSAAGALGFGVPLIGLIYPVFFGNPLQSLIINFIDPLIGSTQESSGWVLLHLFMALVGAVYGFVIGIIIEKIRGNKA